MGADPAAAEASYEAATRELIELTRDTTRFPMLFKENIYYGFHRNMLGLRPWGVRIALAMSVATVLMMITDQPSFLSVDDSVGMTLVFMDLVAALAWWRLVTPDWVKQPAFAYAERLLETTADLAS